MQPKLSQKRLRGAVYTPHDVARELTRYVCLNKDVKNLSILEPSVGDGAFLRALCDQGVEQNKIQAVDISKVAVRQLSIDYDKVNLVVDDFISYSLKNSEKHDVVIGNPPYIRRHNYTKKLHANISRLSKASNYQLGDLRNAWAAFLVASLSQLKHDGVLAFILPYELMTVSYGRQIQNWLNEHFKRVDVFVPRNKAFPDIDQDAVTLIARNDEFGADGFYMHDVESLADLNDNSPVQVTFDDALSISIEQKKFLLKPETVQFLHKVRARLDRVSDYCDSSTGIVTAANSFFILTEKQVKEHGLEKWAKPILKKASYLSKSVDFSKEDLERLQVDEPCCLIDFGNIAFDDLDEHAKAYVRLGESQGLNNRFKCRNRKPWYRVPVLDQTEGFFFKRSHLLPRINVNKAEALVTDTAYRIRMKPGRNIEHLCYSFYNSLTLLFAEIDGRFYGGGVLEVTPNEFKNLPLAYVEPKKVEYKKFKNAVERELKKPSENFTFGDDWLKQKMQFSTEEMIMLQDALITVRSHRLRHGSKLAA